MVAALLVVAAGLVAVKAWQATYTSVRWMRPRGFDIAHAIPKTELASELVLVQAIAGCGRWSADRLVRDDGAERCVACERTVDRLEHRHM